MGSCDLNNYRDFGGTYERADSSILCSVVVELISAHFVVVVAKAQASNLIAIFIVYRCFNLLYEMQERRCKNAQSVVCNSYDGSQIVLLSMVLAVVALAVQATIYRK